MVKQFLVLALSLLIMTIAPSVSAEQAAAEQYRQLINSGEFFWSTAKR
mgnify:CR=1 FL=1